MAQHYRRRRGIAALLSICILFLVCTFGLAEDYSGLKLRELFSSQREKVTWNDDSEWITYGVYLAEHETAPLYSGRSVDGEITQEEADSAVIRVQAPETALYTIRYTYQCTESESNLYASFTLDGGVPFREAEALTFDWIWQEESKPIRNILGDDVRARQVRVSDMNSRFFTDADGFVSGALRFLLEEGEHQIDLTFASTPVQMLSFTLEAPENAPLYADMLKDRLAKGWNEPELLLEQEAEDEVAEKNAAVIQRIISDDPLSTPYEAGYKRLNTFGGTTYQEGQQYVAWQIHAPETGLYHLSLRCSTPTDQLPVYRRLEIDEHLPFEEAKSLEVPYMEDLQCYTLPYLLPLEAGDHILKLTVDISPYTEDIRTLQRTNDALSRIMLNLTMLIGSNPDANYDYNIEKSMPSLKDDLLQLSETLKEVCERLHDRCGKASLAENSLRQNAELLLSIRRNLRRIQNHTTDLSSIQTNLSLWEENLAKAPLLLDRLMLGKMPGQPMTSSALQKTEAVLTNFMLSFSKDYDQVGSRAEGENLVVLDVWASMSTEAADILKSLCDARFTPNTGIHINLNILPSGQLNAGAVNVLLLSIVSGNEPDVALGVSAGTPVELAIRDAVVDLSKLPGYDELVSQIPDGALTVNRFQDGVYGIPERLGFSVMFYRRDILSALNLSLPETWTEVYHETLPILYQNNLEMLIPHQYPMFLYQYGGRFYDETGLKTALDTPEAYQAFKSMTELYTKYAIPYTTNFYNRFRSGEVPIGIAGFGDYMSLTVGAKNLSGKWGIAAVPGTERSDGTISHATSGAVESSAVIMSASDYQEESWAFLQWWMSAETQLEYAREVEKRIGTGARVNTANTEAFTQLDWPAEDLPILLRTRENAVETPGVLGGYYVSRHINNAWNAVITGSDQVLVRDEFEHAIEMIQTEMDNKQAEYAHLVDR